MRRDGSPIDPRRPQALLVGVEGGGLRCFDGARWHAWRFAQGLPTYDVRDVLPGRAGRPGRPSPRSPSRRGRGAAAARLRWPPLDADLWRALYRRGGGLVIRRGHLWQGHGRRALGLTWYDGTAFRMLSAREGLYAGRIALIGHDGEARVWLKADDGHVAVYPREALIGRMTTALDVER